MNVRIIILLKVYAKEKKYIVRITDMDDIFSGLLNI